MTERGSHQRFELRQIGKATLAAALAWFLAHRVMPHEAVWIAPATAVIMVHATVYQTLTNGVRRVSAVAAGVILAGSVGYVLGLNALSLVLVVPPALIAARWRRMGGHGTDVATTVVLMLSFGAASQQRYLLAYVVATAIGALIGALIGAMVNIFLWPPLYRRRPHEAVLHLSTEASALLSDIADGLGQRCDLSQQPAWEQHANRLDLHLSGAHSGLADGAESRRYNLRRRAQPAPGHHPPVVRAMGQIGVHLHAIVGVLGYVAQQHDDDECPPQISEDFARDYADLLRVLAQAVAAQVRLAQQSEDLRELLKAARRQADAIPPADDRRGEQRPTGPSARLGRQRKPADRRRTHRERPGRAPDRRDPQPHYRRLLKEAPREALANCTRLCGCRC
ncbi:FUSC family protein [Nonomuraea sp. LPB2021202275-12-8]|uniref:FUSC family protein n=1 Tax=Nonomuraea sp. LPB2021202275-12-8 TaxID=3120159 RepID=UPI00300DBC2A